MESLKEFFAKREDVAFSFLFGSQARGKAIPSSDIDIAVYFPPENPRPIQFEEAIFYDQENELWAALERLLRKEVELLVLNRVPATIAASALRGIPVAIKNWGLYIDFMQVVTSQAIDFRDLLIKDFREREGYERGT